MDLNDLNDMNNLNDMYNVNVTALTLYAKS